MGDREMRKTKGEKKRKRDLTEIPNRSKISVQPGEVEVKWVGKSCVVGLWYNDPYEECLWWEKKLSPSVKKCNFTLDKEKRQMTTEMALSMAITFNIATANQS